jgi:hypothetical protein
MATLKNHRHERFATFIAGGMTATEAYQQAGFSGRGAPQSASRLAKTPAVANRIVELKRALSDSTLRKSLIDREWVIARLKHLAEAAETGSARIRALELCGRELGMFREQREDTFMNWDGDLRKLSSAQLEKMMSSLEAMVADREPPADGVQ